MNTQSLNLDIAINDEVMHSQPTFIQPYRPKVAIPSAYFSRPQKAKIPSTRAKLSPIDAPRRKRRGAPKARTGCQTCKIRHKKCDETHPACNRCIGSGRTCDFLKSPPPKSTAATPALSPSSRCSSVSRSSVESIPPHPLRPYELTELDGYAAQHFVDFVLPIRTRDSPSQPVWILGLQMSESEPCIRHVSLAIGIMHRIYPYIVASPGDPKWIPYYYSAIRHYAASVRYLKERLGEKPEKANVSTWELSILASYLFTSFEVLIGNENGAHWQNINGMKLMKSALTAYRSQSNQLKLPGHLTQLALAQNKRDIQGTTFGLGYETQVLLEPQVVESFWSFTDAENVLDTILPNVLSLIKKYGPPEWQSSRLIGEALPNDLDQQIDAMKVVLQCWYDTFEAFLASHHDGCATDQDTITRNTLLIQYWTAYIWLQTPYSTSQLVYDKYLPQFTNIVELAEEIITIQPDRHAQFSADNAIIHPLFYTAQKCRDGHVRRKATGLLNLSGREGVWDGACVAAAARWWIEKEEEGLVGKDVGGSVVEGSEGFVEEKWRLRGTFVTMNRLAKSQRIAAKRVDKDGDYWVEGSVEWGSGQEEVVYGDSENLWQRGQLFG